MSSGITNLPIEVIDLIFGHLTMANDRRRTAQVCKLFNKVIRSQSIRNRNNILRLDEPLMGESPFRVFNDWESLPFSTLIISVETWNQFIVKESEFWSVHGHEISKMILYIDNFNTEKSLLLVSLLSSYFPNLKKLKIDRSWMTNSDVGPNVQNTLNCSLPIVELSIFSINSHEVYLTFLRCSPYLKKFKIGVTQERLPKILPWLESVEASCLHFYDMPLAKLINLPSNVVFGKLTIQVAEKPEIIRKFFKQPRVIETLILIRQDDNLEFNEDEEEDENNPEFIYFTREQVEALLGAKSIKKVTLPRGVLDFAGSLDLLAQLRGIDSISLDLTRHRPDHLYPLYWSSSETAKKIHEIKHPFDSALNYLDGLSSLTTFSVPYPEEYEDQIRYDTTAFGLSSDDIQHLIRNCPNLKKLEILTILANDADLIGTGDRLPFSSLEKLESLNISEAPNITSEAFKIAFKFPFLKLFYLSYYSEESFNQQDAIFFTQNCPNMRKLSFESVDMNEDAFDYLIHKLPYLRKIYIVTKDDKQISEEQLKVMKKEFPYMRLVLNGYIFKSVL